jgi:uncharacterized membrane protein HdeD (DUF308 family)
MGAPQGYDPKELTYRIGTFFLMVGIALLVFFVMSEAAQSPTFNLFCSGTILLIIGLIFRAQYRKATKPSGRFSLLKKLIPKPKEDKAKK